MKKVTLAKDFTDRVDASLTRHLRAGWTGDVSDDKAAEMEAEGVLATEPPVEEAATEPPVAEAVAEPEAVAADEAVPETVKKRR